MTKEALIKKTVENISKLPEQKLKEVADFTEFLLYKTQDRILTEGIQKLISGSESFNFLEDEEDLYSKEHAANIWSCDGSRIGFFDRSTRETANPALNNSRDAMRWIVNVNGSGLKAAEGYGKYNITFGTFGWAHTELAYYAFGSHPVIDAPYASLCKMFVDSNNVVSGSIILDAAQLEGLLF